jgi:hypothetical protein
MPKYQIVQYYQTATTYLVEASNEQDALDMVSNGLVEFDTKSGSEFVDETIEEIYE